VRTTSIGHGRKVLGEETLDGMRKKKTMRRKKIAIKELGFFSIQTCFIYNQTIMGLSKLKVQKHLWAFIFCPEQKIRQRQYIKDKIRVKDEQVYVKEHNAPRHGLGGSYHEKRRNKKLKHKSFQNYHRRKFIRQAYLYFEPIPEKFRL
jgi:hypothetical protein